MKTEMSKKKNEPTPEEEVKQEVPAEESTEAEAPAASDTAPAVDEAAASNDRYLRLMAE